MQVIFKLGIKNLSMILYMPLLPHLLAWKKDTPKEFQFLGDDEDTWQGKLKFLKHMEDHSSNNYDMVINKHIFWWCSHCGKQYSSRIKILKIELWMIQQFCFMEYTQRQIRLKYTFRFNLILLGSWNKFDFKRWMILSISLLNCQLTLWCFILLFLNQIFGIYFLE